MELKQSGSVQEFGTGAVRDTDTEKARVDLLSPYAMSRIYYVLQDESDHLLVRPSIFLLGEKVADYKGVTNRNYCLEEIFVITARLAEPAERVANLGPVVTAAVRRLVKWLELGALRYAERNWEKGIPVARCVSSLDRHVLAVIAGETDEDHHAATLCNSMFLLHYHEMIARGVLAASLDDRLRYEPKEDA